jgi:hypothetical protein
MDVMDSVLQNLKSALDADQAKQFPRAYIHYIQCMEQICLQLKQPNRNINTGNHFQIHRQCLERSEYLLKNFTEIDWQFFQKSDQPLSDYENMKKQVEKQALEKLKDDKRREETLRQELIIKREKESMMDFQIQNLKNSWRKSSGWKLRDKFTDLLDQNFKYENLSRELILRDQIWMEKVKNETNTTNIVMDHLNALLNDKEYPLQPILLLFVSNFQKDFSQKTLLNCKNEVVFLQNALDDLDVFLSRLTYSLVIRYWGFSKEKLLNSIDSRELEDVLRKLCQNYMMKNGLSLIFMTMYHIQTKIKDKNAVFNLKVKQLKTMKLIDLPVPKSLDISYSMVVIGVSRFENADTPEEKMNNLILATQSIAQCVTNSYKLNQLIQIENETPHISMEETFKIFGWCLMQANVKDGFSTLQFLKEFCVMDKEVMKVSMNVLEKSLDFIAGYKN